MTAKLRSWWQKIKQRPVVAILVFVGSALGIALIVVVVLGYWLNWHWTGLVPETSEPKQLAKTLWDWLNLLGVLAIPAVVGLGAAWYTAQQGKVSERGNKDNQREAALQVYIDKISELLLKEHLGELTADGKLKPEYEQVRKIARVRTITVLVQLDARRIGYVFAFLHEAGLMSNKPNESIVSLSQANLREINLSGAHLEGANLSGAYLSGADLREAFLSGVNLSGAYLYRATFSYGADLREANLSGAYLPRADLSRAYLRKADLTGADLHLANLREAILSEADLTGVSLTGADLTGADLSPANLSEANLREADLTGVNLLGAKVTEEQLKEAQSLKGATMPDGSIHP